MSTISSTTETGAVPDAIDGIVELPSPFPLHHGGEISCARISYRLAGPAGAPVVIALGGISAHRIVAAPKTSGWWHALVGPGLGLDTMRFRVLGIDYLGGRGESTAPAGGEKFPTLSAWDQAAALAHLVQALKISPVRAIMGASYGGMIALAFAKRYPALTRRIIVMSSSDHTQPLATAWRSVQRALVRDALSRGDGAAGLKLARALAMTTYRSPVELAQRFSGPPVLEEGRFRFPIEQYLFARGDEYARYYRPESFLCLSESIDLFTIDAANLAVETTLIGVREDQLVPIADVRALAAIIGARCHLIEVSSICGHDAFLTEGAMFKPIIDKILTEA